MILGIPREILAREQRVAALPETVKEYVEMGFDVLVQSSAGQGALRSDERGLSVEPTGRMELELLGLVVLSTSLLKILQVK